MHVKNYRSAHLLVWVGKGAGKGIERQRDRERAPFVLRTYIISGIGEEKLHIDEWASMVPAFLGECDYPSLVMCEGLLTEILIFLQSSFVHFVVKQICDRTQLIKIEELSKVIYGLFL